MRAGRAGRLVLAAALSGFRSLAAQSPPAEPPVIEDNSFLLEEAYNQERGVVQHISLFSRGKSGSWVYAFTQEWPVPGQRHQLSYTIPLVHPDGGSAGLGDIYLNYRLQVLGREGGRVWMAPRLSAVLPTGKWRRGRGDGALGMSAAVPVSITWTPRFRTHLNLGGIVLPRAHSPAGERATTTTLTWGGSGVFEVTRTVNLMLEAYGERAQEVAGASLTASSTSMVLSPGLRLAFNFKSGLQIVPGAAYMVRVAGHGLEDGLLLYLSFEHSFRKE